MLRGSPTFPVLPGRMSVVVVDLVCTSDQPVRCCAFPTTPSLYLLGSVRDKARAHFFQLLGCCCCC